MLGAIAVGLAAGFAGGMIGVGGGVLFVPGLVLFIGLGQLDAQATSLLAVVLVAAVGAWRQARYGNLRLRDGVIIGVLSPIGVLAGTTVANLVTERCSRCPSRLSSSSSPTSSAQGMRPAGTADSPSTPRRGIGP